MTSLSEISVVRVPTSAEDRPSEAAPDVERGPLEVQQSTGSSPVTLAVLAVLAGIGAMAMGGLAVIAATASGGEESVVVTTSPEPAPAPAPPSAERAALALLAKPSTERVVFRGSGGRLVLVVGSGGRAAVLVRGIDRVPAGRPYFAWVIRSGKPVRAARFTVSERAAFLSVPVARGDSVVVGTEGAAALRPGPTRIVAKRG